MILSRQLRHWITLLHLLQALPATRLEDRSAAVPGHPRLSGGAVGRGDDRPGQQFPLGAGAGDP